jgi:hypothetical protein
MRMTVELTGKGMITNKNHFGWILQLARRRDIFDDNDW